MREHISEEEKEVRDILREYGHNHNPKCPEEVRKNIESIVAKMAAESRKDG